MANTAAVPVWIGANFWSRAGGPRMWARYDGRLVREELAVLAENGCNITRSFCYWPDFVPSPEPLDEEVCARFADFLEPHRELGLGTIPTFIVGHMSGQNWDPSWRAARDPTGTSGWCPNRPGSSPPWRPGAWPATRLWPHGY